MRHGGNLHEAKSLFPKAPSPWIDLSTGINPQAYPFTVPAHDAFSRLPAPEELRRIEEIAAHAYDVEDPHHVTAGPGSQTFIQALPRLCERERVAILGPTYSEHEIRWRREGHDVVHVCDLREATASGADTIVVVNPNNPDGRIVSRDELTATAHSLHARGGRLVVDEAFADLAENVSVSSLDLPSTVVLRSFGKAYGLAGVRLGFAIADPALTERIREVLGSWPVSGPALAIGAQALADRAWLSAQRQHLDQAVYALDDCLRAADFTIIGGTRLFRLASHPSAPAVFDRLAHDGIWVRRFDHDAKLLRFGVPAAADFARLARSLAASYEANTPFSGR